jgi:collagenase-like PrtC family protease
MKQLPRFIEKAHTNSLKINYTINTSCVGSIELFHRKLPEIRSHLLFLQSAGVDRITLSHPLLMEIASNETTLPIEVSTICHIDSVSQIREFVEQFRIDKLCMNIYRNRDIIFLYKAQQTARTAGAEIELIANEFCSTNGAACIYRDSCYAIHSHGGNIENLFDAYPMNRCIKSRKTLAAWIRGMFILPEDVHAYQEKTGIRCFKVTGRTHPTQAMLRIAEYYIRQKSPDNLLDLWIHLQNIGRKWRSFIHSPPCVIPTSKLITDGFSDKWLKQGFRCSADCIGPEGPCDYCDGFLSQ